MGEISGSGVEEKKKGDETGGRGFDFLPNATMPRRRPRALAAAGTRPMTVLCLALLLLALAWAPLAGAHTIDLGPGEKECFFEDLHRDDKARPFFASRVPVALICSPLFCR
jgi:hypothetical protein